MAFDAPQPEGKARPKREAQPVVRQRMPLGRTRRRLSFERRVRLWLGAAAVPFLLTLAWICKADGRSLLWSALLLAVAAVTWAIVASYFFESLIRPLQTLSNIVAALREEDFAFRARGARRGDALALADRVMTSMPSPVLAFDADGRLRLMNAAGERAFALQRGQALGQPAEALRLQTLFAQRDESVYPPQEAHLAEGSTRWSVRRSAFRLHGVPHTLFVLSDVAAALQEEERIAWQRLIRVLGHEINNSLTPIKSIAGTLRSRPLRLASTTSEPASWDDLQRGLTVIEERADSLNRFLQGYQRLSRLPPPRMQTVGLRALVERTIPLEPRLRVEMQEPSPDVTLKADGDQLQQMLINLLKNAADAALDPEMANAAPSVIVRWTCGDDGQVVLQILDNGQGLANPTNLFVPFYTTKPDGAGIGLTLSRQIVAAHRGSILLRNRDDRPGCIAEVSLPLTELPTF